VVDVDQAAIVELARQVGTADAQLASQRRIACRDGPGLPAQLAVREGGGHRRLHRGWRQAAATSFGSRALPRRGPVSVAAAGSGGSRVGRSAAEPWRIPLVIERRTSARLAPPPAYSHVVTARGNTSVWTAGGVPLDDDGELVGAGDHRAQAAQVLDNLLVALREAGAGPEHVVKTTVYVVGDQDALPAVWEVVRASPIGAALPASTLLGVERLGYRGQLVEIEAVAALD
jgi:enamine deaminase RidA (YjgF/YER057c/UK114 family)